MQILESLSRSARRVARRLRRLGTRWRSPAIAPDGSVRILFVSNALVPTLQICFIKPLKPLLDNGSVAVEFITELELNRKFGHYDQGEQSRAWITGFISDFKPTVVVFCRYSGPNADHIVETAHASNIPTILHIDDDLLGVPLEIGERKYAMHNEPSRIRTVRHLLDETDLVYCSTAALERRLKKRGVAARTVAGRINCSGDVLVPASRRQARKIGYMGFDHAHDLAMILPALEQFLDGNPQMEFELFGSIPKPAALDRFGDRIKLRPPIAEYEQFLQTFATLDWDIGICPLVKTPFNVVKSNNKWVEYTSVGIAVVASAGTIYDACCADGCGSLANGHDQWLAELNRLARDDSARHRQVVAAQARLREEYSTERLRKQVLSVLGEAGT